MRLTTIDVPCPLCRVPAQAPCVFALMSNKLGQPMPGHYHGVRSDDARTASVTATTLIGGDA